MSEATGERERESKQKREKFKRKSPTAKATRKYKDENFPSMH